MDKIILLVLITLLSWVVYFTIHDINRLDKEQNLRLDKIEYRLDSIQKIKTTVKNG